MTGWSYYQVVGRDSGGRPKIWETHASSFQAAADGFVAMFGGYVTEVKVLVRATN